MPLDTFCEIFHQMCQLEYEMLKSDNTTATAARILHDILDSLYDEFFKIKSFEFDNNESNSIRLSIHKKEAVLRTKLEQILESKAEEKSTQNFQLPNHLDQKNGIDVWELLLQEQRTLIKMIKLLEWNIDLTISANQAEILLKNVDAVYQTSLCNQQNILQCAGNDYVSENWFKISKNKEIQRKVDHLQKKLKEMIALGVLVDGFVPGEIEEAAFILSNFVLME